MSYYYKPRQGCATLIILMWLLIVAGAVVGFLTK